MNAANNRTRCEKRGEVFDNTIQRQYYTTVIVMFPFNATFKTVTERKPKVWRMFSYLETFTNNTSTSEGKGLEHSHSTGEKTGSESGRV